MTASSLHTYTVPAISCDHCVSAITGEVSAVDGVTSVQVDVDAKLVTVAGGDRVAVIEAIDEAGYDVAGDAPATAGRSAAVAEQQLDDGVVRVTKWTFAPNSETTFHRHDYDYVVVPVTNGTLTIEGAEGTSTHELTIGASYNRAAGVEHNVANDGEATVAFVEVELLKP